MTGGAPWCESPPEDQSAIDRGAIPARTIRQLVSALRQNLAGAAIDVRTLVLALDEGKEQEAREAIERLSNHLLRADEKLTLSITPPRASHSQSVPRP